MAVCANDEGNGVLRKLRGAGRYSTARGSRSRPPPRAVPSLSRMPPTTPTTSWLRPSTSRTRPIASALCQSRRDPSQYMRMRASLEGASSPSPWSGDVYTTWDAPHPGADGTSDVYDDDGLSFEHTGGNYMRRSPSGNARRSTLRFSLAPGSRLVGTAVRSIDVRRSGHTRTELVRFDGSPIVVRLGFAETASRAPGSAHPKAGDWLGVRDDSATGW